MTTFLLFQILNKIKSTFYIRMTGISNINIGHPWVDLFYMKIKKVRYSRTFFAKNF